MNETKLTIDDFSVKVTIAFVKGNVLAQVHVIVCGVFETHGWRITKSKFVHPVFQEQVWIHPPSYTSGSLWKKMIFVANPELYKQLEAKIYDAYHYAKQHTPPESGVIREEVKVEDIPI